MYIGERYKTNQGCVATITKIISEKKVIIKFDDDFDYEKEVFVNQLNSGQVKNPYHPSIDNRGYIGVGSYSSSKNRKPYSMWSQLLKREKEVEKDWLNFQSFAKWYYDSAYDCNEILMLNNKLKNINEEIYSKETCFLVPKKINDIIWFFSKNLIENKSNKNNLPTGIVKRENRKTKKYAVQLQYEGGKRFFKYYETIEEALEMYKLFKNNLLKEKILIYKDILPKDLYEVLINYKI